MSQNLLLHLHNSSQYVEIMKLSRKFDIKSRFYLFAQGVHMQVLMALKLSLTKN